MLFLILALIVALLLATVMQVRTGGNMPWDTVLYGEAQAADGLTGVAALAGQNHKASGDTIELLKKDIIWLQGLGGLSDTKPQACALVPTNLRSQMPIYGPASIDFWKDGWARWLRDAPIAMFKGDIITGQISTTNVNEGQIVAMDLVYDNVIPPWLLKDIQSRYKEIFPELFTITSGAAVTFNSGGVSLDSAASNFPKWSDPTGEFEILGTMPHLGAETFGGICNVTKLGGDWIGRQPGLVVPPLSAVKFSPGAQFRPALNPIPFDGDALPEVGITATSAGAMIFAMLIGKLPQ